jgi:hypothetical protein
MIDPADEALRDRDTVREITFTVVGYPPGKNEAKSMLGDGHSHASRVRLLLDAARSASQAQGFVPIETGRVGLDVVVNATTEEPTWDATNYLGGIADVLEHKAHRGPLEHLGELAAVWLYRNDRQIKQLSYRETAATEARYTVTVRRLDWVTGDSSS